MFALEMRLLGYWTSSVAHLKFDCAHQSSAYLALTVCLTSWSCGQAGESLGTESEVWAPRGGVQWDHLWQSIATRLRSIFLKSPAIKAL